MAAKRNRGPMGAFKPAEAEARVDATKAPPIKAANLTRSSERRADIAGGTGDVTMRRRRRLMLTQAVESEESATRADAFRLQKGKLDQHGRESKDRELPVYRAPRAIDSRCAEALTRDSSLWATIDKDIALSYGDDSVVPALVSSDYRDSAIVVPPGTIATYVGMRRVTGRRTHDSEKRDVVRGIQHVFVILGKRCAVWDFSLLSPLPDDEGEAQ